MEKHLLERLSALSEEERQLLEGGELIRSTYTQGSSFVVNGEKLLPPSQMITVRPHTRFVDFPLHSHD